MEKSQLPLIEMLHLDRAVESTAPRAARKHEGISQMPHAIAVQALLSGPTTLAHLVDLEGTANGEVLIEALRQFGLQLPVHSIPMFDTNWEIIMLDVCMLTAADLRRIHRALKKSLMQAEDIKEPRKDGVLGIPAPAEAPPPAPAAGRELAWTATAVAARLDLQEGA